MRAIESQVVDCTTNVRQHFVSILIMIGYTSFEGWKKDAMAGAVKERKTLLRIPCSVVLPFGYRITVRQLSDAEMDKRDENADGIWDDETKTIYIRKRLPVTRRRYILAHELGHAWLDWQHRYMDDGKAST